MERIESCWRQKLDAVFCRKLPIYKFDADAVYANYIQERTEYIYLFYLG